MLILTYGTFIRLLKTVPICPLPKAVGSENIPIGVPTLYVYNHITRRGEPLFLGMAAPARPNIRFFAEINLIDPEYFPRLRRDMENSMFSKGFQQKVRKVRLIQFYYEKFLDFLARYMIAQIKRFRVIPVYLHPPPNDKERRKKQRTNRKALEMCVESLENNIPVAIAPSGGSTYEFVKNPIYHTIVPTLASWLYRRGKTIRIVPSVIKEHPMINNKTYIRYVADRVIVCRFLRSLLNFLKRESLQRPRLTVEFLPPLTFKNPHPTKEDKLDFVRTLQKQIYDALRNG